MLCHVDNVLSCIKSLWQFYSRCGLRALLCEVKMKMKLKMKAKMKIEMEMKMKKEPQILVGHGQCQL